MAEELQGNILIMDTIVNWIIDNREWVFSGIGVTILLLILKGIRYFIASKRESVVVKQTNKKGVTTQIGIQNNYYSEDCSESGNQSNTKDRNQL